MIFTPIAGMCRRKETWHTLMLTGSGPEPEVSTASEELSKRREGKVPLAKSVCFGVQTTRVEEIRLLIKMVDLSSAS